MGHGLQVFIHSSEDCAISEGTKDALSSLLGIKGYMDFKIPRDKGTQNLTNERLRPAFIDPSVSIS